VNYFSAHGDRRWWNDHRFPAGMAFSMNSVGHMTKSGQLLRAMHDLEQTMGMPLLDFKTPKVESLDKALELAMRTISLASETVSGKATFLVPTTAEVKDQLRCPVDLPKFLENMDFCSYKGYYHTDFTLPSEYFHESIERPSDIEPYGLDFTYLFDDRLDNPDFDRMGNGRRIRESGSPSNVIAKDEQLYPNAKRLRGLPTEVQINAVRRLREALNGSIEH
jgi:hypothetical protein